jgi:hypothetical protein
MQEHTDERTKDATHHEDEVPANQQVETPTGGTEDDDGPQQRKRGNRSGKKKLFDLQRVVVNKEKELLQVARYLGPENFLK